MPTYDYECDRCGRFEMLQKITAPTARNLSQLRQSGPEADQQKCGHHFQGQRLLCH